MIQTSMKERLIAWFRRVTNKKWMMYFISAYAFLESVIFPVPVEVFTFPLSVAHPHKWKLYATVATLWSVVGGICGYFLGFYLFDTFGKQLIELYGYQEVFEQAVGLFNKNIFWVMLIGAFTPIPYKIFTLSGGALQVALLPFILASIVGRGLRFFIGCYIGYRFGEVAGSHILKNFNRYTLILGLLAISYFTLHWFF